MPISALALNVDTATNRLNVEDKIWCYGYFTFGGSDTYATGGFDVTALIKARFGVSRVEALFFGNGISDSGSGGTHIGTGEAAARYEYSTGKVKLYLLGRLGAPGGTGTTTAQASEVEAANNAQVDAGRLDFWAICS
ncbi:MAG: hypothetical protein FJZ00_03115 [Candidatus Sericytochromatia bacterium]|uniref:Uncharacterized protein n=1 Tax=Candidatus Tanganyikabacteria bacterium TaxID=2961651 RepID=A0A938BKD8_9BACT|nr:hypothetical protein [Candidatus Tanganyikabacteria bacterium]